MLRHEAEFKSPLPPAVARGALVNWLQSIGYQLTSPHFLSSVSAQRGSMMGNFGSLNPRNWQAVVRLSCQPDGDGSLVTLDWEIATAGQTCTVADIAFWRYEIATTLSIAVGATPDVREHQKQGARAQSGDTWRALVFTAIVVVPLIAGIALTGSMGVASLITLATGCVGYFSMRAPRRLGEIPVPPPPPPTMEAPPVMT